MMEVKTTTDHEKIRAWVEARNGIPAVVKGVSPGSFPAQIHVIFGSDPGFEEISWDEFFATFENARLAFRYDAAALSSNAALSFSIIGRSDQESELGESEETEFPENRPEMNENLFPSND